MQYFQPASRVITELAIDITGYPMDDAICESDALLKIDKFATVVPTL
jgi:hypothetical protein